MTDATDTDLEASTPAQAGEATVASRVRAARSAHAQKAARSAKGTFARMHGPKPPPERKAPRTRSRVTNGRALFINGHATTAAARRLADILGEVVSDLGGAENLSEGQRQLARRAASLSVACEKLEAQLCGAPEAIEERIKQLGGGLSPHQILGEAGRLLHAVARAKAPGVHALASLPPVELDRVTDLLVKAADISAKAIAAGSEHGADLELLGQLADRCGRTFQRLGIKRTPRDLSQIEATAQQQPEVWSPLRSALSAEFGEQVETEVVDQ